MEVANVSPAVLIYQREGLRPQQLTRKHLKIRCSELEKSSLRSILMAGGKLFAR